MEIRIGVNHSPREVVLESNDSADKISKAVDAALASGETLKLKDDKGRVVIVPASAIAYVDIAAADKGKVGFGA
jgi:hypothetical protein